MIKFSLLIGILLWQGMALSALATERVALVIGNNNYQESDRLSTPINDAQDIAQALKSLGFKVIYTQDATQRVMQQTVNQFIRQLRKDSISVFYYAGHGAQHAGENYLIPVDFRGQTEDDYQQQAIMAYQILADMKAKGSSTSIMILDACRDNSLAQSSTRSLRRGGATSGLASMPEMSGSYIAFSTSPGKVAYDGDGRRNSPYAHHLIRFIKEPIPIEIMFKRVRTAVIEETRNKDYDDVQVPWESSSLVGTDFCFVEGCGQRVSHGYGHNVTQCKMRWGKGEYQGECKNGRPDGYGVQRYPNGEYYKGAFINGLRHGEGTQYLPDGTEIVADWEYGRPK
jgi:uncharacterized caspase-like protein